MHAPLRIAGFHGGWRLSPDSLGSLRLSMGIWCLCTEDRKQLDTWVRTWSRVQVGVGIIEEPDKEVILFMLLLCSMYL